MTLTKRYVLRLFISIKYITANVVDRNSGRIVATSSTAEHDIKQSLECVLARRLKVEGLNEGEGRGIHVNVNKEIEKKGFKSQTKILAVVNALKYNGVKLVRDDEDDGNNP
ncbi:50S ribosomal L18-like protein [Medicago truncatula]|uniref:50S ribosomal L18-like protein n=1 Tax=Medicago truncatula TaxID=3880 RepID=G7I699_MEDTR|nr:50S ribosomal L18-like protein [Medicago truncatula]